METQEKTLRSESEIVDILHLKALKAYDAIHELYNELKKEDLDSVKYEYLATFCSEVISSKDSAYSAMVRTYKMKDSLK